MNGRMAVYMDLLPSDKRPQIAFILKMGALAAFLATVVSALLIAILSALNPMGGATSPSVLDLVKAAFWLCPITAVSCGSFGFVAGIAGSALLSLRRHRIRSTKRLLIESGIAGFLLGFVFPFFDRLLNPPSLNTMEILLSAPVGMCCAMLCTFVLRKHFLP